MNASPPRPPSQPETTLLLATGDAERTICFHPSLFQLVIRRGDEEERVELGYAGSRLLDRLLQTPGEVVAREELMNHAWPDRVVGQGSLNQQIYSLRQLFCDEKGREVIQTLPRRGYQFNPSYVIERRAIAPLPAMPAATSEEIVPSIEPTPNASRPRWPAIALFCITLLAGLGVSAWVKDLPGGLATRNTEYGQVMLHLVADYPSELDALEHDSTPLLARLAELSSGPVLATLDRYGGYFQLFCHQASGVTNWVMFHPSQMDRLTDEQLSQCLP